MDLVSALIVSIFFALILDQLQYYYKKKSIPGPRFKIPIVGDLLKSFNPTFDGYLQQWQGNLRCTTVLHKFIVFVNSAQTVREVLARPETFVPAGPASFRDMMDPNNWIFLTGVRHSNYRKMLKPLFDKNSLEKYQELQTGIFLKYINKWIEMCKVNTFIKIQDEVRDLNIESSLEVICGLNNLQPSAIGDISRGFYDMLQSLQLVNIPINLPFTALGKGLRAKEKILDHLRFAVRTVKGKGYILENSERSLLEKWICSNPEVSDEDMAITLLSMLFAGQDAATSAMVWSIQILADHPDIVYRLREFKSLDSENYKVYLTAVVKEVLRSRPPVFQMPYEAIRDTALEGHPIVKGTFVIASFYPTLHNGDYYPDPEEFIPERFIPDKIDPNYLVFGYGPHLCIGNGLARKSTETLIDLLLSTCDFDHIKTKDSDKIKIFAATYPQDGCLIRFSQKD